jgi:uncharacterized protein
LRIEEHFEIDALPDDVWTVLRDPAAVAQCLPGAELTEQTDNETFVGRIRVRFGPTIASFTGQARIVIDDAARSAGIEAAGTDGRGSSRAKVRTTVQLMSEGQRSAVALAGAIEVIGPLSNFAEAGGVYIARELIREFAANVAARSDATGGPPSAAHNASAPPPLSGRRLLWLTIHGAMRSVRRRLGRIWRPRAPSSDVHESKQRGEQA